ncbi:MULTISPECIES: peptidoglycan recognition protein family protein [Saccharibacillus]|uniref:peptidoglycan recognition protein family protein n=1 Tax=Saccharibacillus TaxID=456492 RepID=UPI00123BD1D7|nr:N-acetylmuramoyl-L-alanine amidase [Saccharibacillus sp. WB 17]MWJ30788.1 N-acetylmuramoyl-L-alanine amidase [Saccharibacillus sp. WB 17]
MQANKYPIERRYIAKRSNTRPGLRLTTGTPAFFVAHDTGNPGAGAESHYRYFNALTDRSASAHTFIDDTKILEIIPAGTDTDPAEKAWHVLYNVKADNERFGYDANDAALGVELCYGGRINFEEAYKRFVWYLAFCCKKWNKDPRLFIPSHKQLDPARKIDCDNALRSGGRTLKELIADVTAELAQPANRPPGGQGTGASAGAGAADGAYAPLDADLAQALIADYVRPAWAAARAAQQVPEAEHFHRLADNLRAAAGINERGAKLPQAVKLHKSNVQELVFRWLSPAWYRAKATGDSAAASAAHEQANALRLAAGLPKQ